MTILAFDYGRKRIGVAVGELMLRQAHPLCTIAAQPDSVCYQEISKLMAEWQPHAIVIGLPASNDPAKQHPLHKAIKHFAHQLDLRFKKPISFADETLSSFAAEEGLSDKIRQRAARQQRQSERIDALAAQIILQTWFEHNTIHPTVNPC